MPLKNFWKAGKLACNVTLSLSARHNELWEIASNGKSDLKTKESNNELCKNKIDQLVY